MPTVMRQIQEQLSKLDKDGDGNVSLDEVEEAGKLAIDKIQKAYKPVKEFTEKYDWGVKLGVGYTATMFGGNFTHLFLCCNSFKAAEYESLKKNVTELVDISKETKKKFVDEVGADAVLVSTGKEDKDKDNVAIPSRTILAALQCIDPNRLMNVFKSLYSGFLVALCAAMNDNAAKFGLGLTMGERISTFMLSMAERLMSRAEKKVAESGESLTDKPAWAWSKLGLKTICTSLGVFISWRLKDAAAVWSTVHYGGHKMSKALFQLLGHKDDALEEMLGLAIAWYGFAHHLKHFNRPNLPFYLAMPLSPLILAEAALKALTLRAGVGQ